nr:M48 family metalloprotease [Lactobacillus sp. ESL0701]
MVERDNYVNDLIQYLFDFAFNQDIGYLLVPADEDYSSFANKTKKLIIINTNWKNKAELPFIIGHEIGHLIDGDQGISRYCGTSLTSKERHADLYSLNLIFDYATKQYDCYEEPSQFMQAYGIPTRMYNDVVNLFRNNDDLLF